MTTILVGFTLSRANYISYDNYDEGLYTGHYAYYNDLGKLKYEYYSESKNSPFGELEFENESEYSWRIPETTNSWYNCTDGCRHYSITENHYTGSVYTSYCGSKSAYLDDVCVNKYTEGTKIKRVDSVGKFWSILSCLIITVLFCVPICSFACMTKKRVYKKSADPPLHGQGIEVAGDDGQIIAGQPVVEEFKQGNEVTPAKGTLIEKEEINT